jgi:SAM-dependent methyltransferase
MQMKHQSQEVPAQWVEKYVSLIPEIGQVLDLACGGGRHSRYLLAKGYSVLALDKDISGLADLGGAPNLEILEFDLENGKAFPLRDRKFSGIIVVNYLFRPILGDLIDVLAEGGVLIYQTFMLGSEAYGRPRNPDFLLKENELREVFGASLDVVAFEQGYVERPAPAVVQKICAVKR